MFAPDGLLPGAASQASTRASSRPSSRRSPAWKVPARMMSRGQHSAAHACSLSPRPLCIRHRSSSSDSGCRGWHRACLQRAACHLRRALVTLSACPLRRRGRRRAGGRGRDRLEGQRPRHRRALDVRRGGPRHVAGVRAGPCGAPGTAPPHLAYNVICPGGCMLCRGALPAAKLFVLFQVLHI